MLLIERSFNFNGLIYSVDLTGSLDRKGVYIKYIHIYQCTTITTPTPTNNNYAIFQWRKLSRWPTEYGQYPAK